MGFDLRRPIGLFVDLNNPIVRLMQIVTMFRWYYKIVLALILLAGTQCVKDFADQPFLAFVTPSASFKITGSVSGLTGTLILKTGSKEVTITGNGPFEFGQRFSSGESYDITASAPSGFVCNVSNASGVVYGDITNIYVNCALSGVAISGLDLNYISQNPGAFNSAQLSWSTDFSGTYIVKHGTDCTSGTALGTGANISGPTSPGATIMTTINASELAAGPNTVHVCLYNAGPTFYDSNSAAITVDNVAPTIAASPTAGNQSSVTSVSFSCTDPGAGCNGMAVSSQTVGAPAAAPNPSDPAINNDGSSPTPAAYGSAIGLTDQSVTTIEVIAVDNAGNVSAVQSFSYLVDASLNSLSSPAATNPYVSAVGTKTSTVFSWISDRSTMPYEIRIGSTDCTDGTVIDSGTTSGAGHTTGAIAASAFALGVNTVRICEENLIGNKGMGITLSVTRDETAPVITSATGAGSSVSYGGTIVYTFSEQIDTGSTVIGGGDLSTEDNGGVWGTTGSFTDDKLTLGPAASYWNPGFARALSLTVYDLAGNSATVNHTYDFPDGTVQPFFSNAKIWNSYIKNDSAKEIDASNVACDETENNFYYGCIHGGEFRKVMVIDSAPDDCTGITATDTNGWYDWVCYDPPGTGPVEVVSWHRKDGIQLADLINFAGPGWNTNAVAIAGSSFTAAPAAQWWSNPVQTIPAAGGAVTTPNVVYVVGSNTQISDTLDIQANNVTLVTAKTANLSVATTNTIVSNTGKSFTWIEGNFDGGTTITDAAIRIIGSSKYHRLDHINVFNALSTSVRGGIYLRDFQDSLIQNVRVANTLAGSGIVVYSAGTNFTRNMFRTLTLNQNSGSGLLFITTGTISDVIVMDSYFFANDIHGLHVQGSGGVSNSIFMNSTALNNTSAGFSIATSGSSSNTFVNLLGVNNGTDGLLLVSNSGNQVIDAGFGDNGAFSVNMNATGRAFFSGLLLSSPAGGNCSGGAGTGITTPGCNAEGASDHTAIVGFNPKPPGGGPIGRMTAADPLNGSARNLTYSPTIDWINFQYPFRGWGLQASASGPYDSGGRARCFGAIGSACWQTDLSLRSGAMEFKDPPGGLSCPPNGNAVVVHNWATATTGSVTFLRHAMERGNDGVSDLPFCLGNEDCIYTPNFGGYQGHNTLTASGCTSIATGGSIENVDFYEYSVNGF
ncbi:MAG: chitobiase/beta-hexosaminidase C-terminal domain-containing protein [Leptospiraceae bacterium]|nr:chitobiase/beta-hexosaminidase C-terminal domain-containing protein [Leptospiraceae bacterium]